MPRSAIFIDRDGALIEPAENGPTTTVTLRPGARAAVRAINLAGKQAVVLTHQPAIARGELDEDLLAEIHERMRSALLEEEIRLDGIYHCPHDASGSVERYAIACACRPPAAGMLERARDEMGVALADSTLIGDRPEALCAANACGIGLVLLRTPRGRETEARLRELGISPAHVADSIEAAVEWALQPRETAQAPAS